MQQLKEKRFTKNNRTGSALLLMLLISVAIGCVIYFMSARTALKSLPIYENPLTSHEMYPWENAECLLKRDQTPNIDLSSGHPPIDEGIDINGYVSESGTHCFIFVTPEGKVSGAWNADYNTGKSPRMNYMMQAKFKGNIDPAVIYFDEDGEDTTKLFMIAKGEILVVASEINGGSIKKEMQQFWMTGWINQDKTAKGKMVILNTLGKTETFTWKSSFNSKKRKGMF